MILFQEKQIRRVWHNEEWYFSVVDVVEILTDSKDPSDYFKKMRKRDEELRAYVGTNCPHVEMEGLEGKKRKILAANTYSFFLLFAKKNCDRIVH